MSPSKKANKELLWLIGIFLVLAVPFIHKPFHIDATAFLLPHANILKNPVAPYDFQIPYLNRENLHFFENMPHPPVTSYLIALVYYFSGGLSETTIHLSFFCFPIIAIISMYFLAMEFSENPLLAATLLLITPAFLVEASQVTSDMPFLALFLATMAAYINGIKGNRRLLYFSILLANLLIMTRYAGFLVLPILFTYSLMEKIPTRKTLPILISFLAFFFLWTTQNIIVHGVPHVLSVMGNDMVFPVVMPFDTTKWFNNFVGITSHLSGSTLFLFLSPVYVLRKSCNVLVLAVSLAAAWLVLGFQANIQEPAYQALFIIFFGIGLFFLIAIILNLILEARPSKAMMANASVFLFSWLIIVWIFNNFVLSFSCARYNLPLIPPLVLLLLHLGESKKTNHQWIWRITPLIALSSVLICKADYDLANAYKRFSKAISTYETQKQIWSTNLWGMHYYLPKFNSNFKIYDHSKVKKGDLLVVSTQASFYSPDPDPLVLLKEDKYFSALPIKILDRDSYAGFYSNGFGPLPFSFSTGEIERFKTYQVMNITAMQSIRETMTGKIDQSNKAGQTFVCKENGLSTIKIMLFVSGENKGHIVFHLKNFPEDASDLATIQIQRKEIEKNSWSLFKFPPLDNSAGRTFYFSLEYLDSAPGSEVRVWKSKKNMYKEGTFFKNGFPANGDMAFIALTL